MNTLEIGSTGYSSPLKLMNTWPKTHRINKAQILVQQIHLTILCEVGESDPTTKNLNLTKSRDFQEINEHPPTPQYFPTNQWGQNKCSRPSNDHVKTLFPDYWGWMNKRFFKNKNLLFFKKSQSHVMCQRKALRALITVSL